MEYEEEGSRPRGRPKRTWKEVVQKDCQARNLNKKDAMDRGRWNKLIKAGWWSGWWEVGWVFLLIPAHPGSPGQRAVKRLSLLLLLLCLWQQYWSTNIAHWKVFEQTDHMFGLDGDTAISATADDSLSICALWYVMKQPLTTHSLHMLSRLPQQLHHWITAQPQTKRNTLRCVHQDEGNFPHLLISSQHCYDSSTLLTCCDFHSTAKLWQSHMDTQINSESYSRFHTFIRCNKHASNMNSPFNGPFSRSTRMSQ